MGPTLATMVARAAREVDDRTVFAVSRFSSQRVADALRDRGVETIRADLLDASAVSSLPDAPNVIYMAGQKFGTSDAPSVTWAMNTAVPTHCAERYRGARIVAFSTGNVYPLVPVSSGGAREEHPLGPIGEYATSCLGRERLFDFFARRDKTRVAIFRLNYAIDLRYGVLTDLALKVRRGVPIPLAMGYVNIIWQGDANRLAIECLERASSPPFVVNVTGSETLSVRLLAEGLGARLGREPVFEGDEGRDALLSDTARMTELFSPPEMPVERMLDLVASWVASDGPLLDKPTHFETRDGKF